MYHSKTSFREKRTTLTDLRVTPVALKEALMWLFHHQNLLSVRTDVHVDQLLSAVFVWVIFLHVCILHVNQPDLLASPNYSITCNNFICKEVSCLFCLYYCYNLNSYSVVIVLQLWALEIVSSPCKLNIKTNPYKQWSVFNALHHACIITVVDSKDPPIKENAKQQWSREKTSWLITHCMLVKLNQVTNTVTKLTW